MTWIKPLTELTLQDTELVGGKAAHLGAMLRAGFEVPEGFVITVDAFIDHFGQITDPLVKPVTPRLAQELMSQVISALTEYLGEESEVAVRSSSTEEDASFASYAGQHSTYYFVPPTQLDQAILDCWMSLWSPAALAYRRAGGANIESGNPLRMAVIVQRMVPATRSGVIFSKDPTGPSADMVLEACWGLGAALVDGHVSPDYARLDEEGVLRSYRTRDKHAQVLPSTRNSDASRLQSLPREKRLERVLTDQEVEHIGNLALQLETLFESPQDVEWSYHDDALYILQSRPITSRMEAYPGHEPLVVFKPLVENFTDALTPLSEDLFAQALPKIGVFFRGRLYIDLDLAAKFLPFELRDRELADMLLLKPAPEKSKWSWQKAFRALGYLTVGLLLDGANWVRASFVKESDLTGYADTSRAIAANPRLSLKQCMQRLVWSWHSFAPAGQQMFMLNISSGRYFILVGLLNALVARFAPDYPINELPKTYHGRRDMRSLQMLAAIDNLTELLHADLTLLEQVAAGDTHLPPGHSFTVAFDQFLQDYGHRGAKEIDIAAPRWREQPGEMLRLLAATQLQNHDQSTSHGEFLAARDELNQRLNGWQRWIVSKLTDSISRFIQLRENTRHYHILAFDRMRTRVLAIEQRLLDQGDLSLSGDIFFLTSDEVEALERGDLEPKEAQSRIRKNRRQWQLHNRQGYEDTLNIEQEESQAPTNALSGLCASPGEVRGKARVLLSPTAGHTLQPGEILVAPYTDPAWTPLFNNAAGVIVANGSFLSHAGTVARELHLPCLVDVQSCTQQISDGQELILNATQGTVEFA